MDLLWSALQEGKEPGGAFMRQLLHLEMGLWCPEDSKCRRALPLPQLLEEATALRRGSVSALAIPQSLCHEEIPSFARPPFPQLVSSNSLVFLVCVSTDCTQRILGTRPDHREGKYDLSHPDLQRACDPAGLKV